MAEILTSVTDTGSFRGWDIPSSLRPGGVPRQEILYSGTTTVPAIVLNNSGRYRLTCILPANFVYRIVAIDLQGRYSQNAHVTDWANGMLVVITIDGVRVNEFPLISVFAIPDAVRDFFVFDSVDPPSSTLLDLANIFLPPAGTSFNEIIEATGVTKIVIELLKPGAVDVGEIVLVHRLRVLQYTFEQALRYPINFPYPTLSL